ncbi:MAG: hypothetical protein R3B93_02235 [Bacteroidia bacterium]
MMHQLAADGKQVRKSIDGYNLEFINSAMMVMASVLIVSTYTISPEVQRVNLIARTFISQYFCNSGRVEIYANYSSLSEKVEAQQKYCLGDFFLQLTIAGWFITFVILIY